MIAQCLERSGRTPGAVRCLCSSRPVVTEEGDIFMARSILERTGERAPRVDKGHTTRELGPGDRSDTGSDITGGPGLENDSDALDLQHGTTSDPERGRRPPTAGPDIGDENLDSDSDS